MGGNLEVQKSEHFSQIEPQKQFINLPLIKNKYRIISIIGSGAFGDVIKVREESTGILYAMKSISLSMRSSSSSQEVNEQLIKKKQVIKSGETELHLLPRLKHPNVVKYIESILFHRSPLQMKGGSTHLLLIMEYIQGSDLEELLLQSETNQIHINECITLKWFTVLLKTLSYVHEKMKVIHRDLKPDNILLVYDNIRDFEKIELKITDFGVASDTNNQSSNISIEDDKNTGHIFYQAPEMLKREKYDSLVDIWALAVIFFQVYFGISTKSYQERVKQLILQIKVNKDLKEGFLKKFKKKDLYSDVTYIELLTFLHDNGYFHQYFMKKFLKEDTAIEKILKLMICEKGKRLYAHQLVNHKIIQTWSFITSENPKEPLISVIKIDFEAVFTILKNIKTEEEMYKKCLDCLILIIKKEFQNFFKNNGLNVLFSKVIFFTKNNDICERLCKFLFELIKIDCTLTRQITILLRSYMLIEMLKKVLLTVADDELFFLGVVLLNRSKTLAVNFSETGVLPFFLKYVSTNNLLVYQILRIIAPYIKNPKEIKKIFAVYKSDDILFFKGLKYFGDDENVLTEMYKRLISSLKECEKKDDKKGMINNLTVLLYLLRGHNISETHDIVLKMNPKYVQNKLHLFKKSKEKNFEIVGDTIKCNKPDEDLFAQFISSKPICNVVLKVDSLDEMPPIHKKKEEEEEVIGYWEAEIIDGGTNDSIILGVILDKKAIYSLNCSKGTIDIVKENGEKEVITYKQLFCETGTFIGVGVTSSGNCFFTYNNKIIRPFINLTFSKPKFEVNSYIYVSGNDFLSFKVNFGLKTFFSFENTKKNFNAKSKSVKTFKKLDYQIIDMIQLKSKKKSLERKLSSAIRVSLENENVQISEDIEILKSFYNNDIFDTIYSKYKYFKQYHLDDNEEEVFQRTIYNFENPSSMKDNKDVGMKKRFRKKKMPPVPEKKMIYGLIERIKKIEGELSKAQEKLKKLEHPGEGWLLKKGKQIKSWKWRYFICNNVKNEFSYYADPRAAIYKDDKPIKTIKLGDDFEVYSGGKGTKPFTFIITTQIRVWYFVASNEQEKTRWIEYWKKGLMLKNTPGCKDGWLRMQDDNCWYTRYFRCDLKRKRIIYYYNEKDTSPIKSVSIDGYEFSTDNSLKFCLKGKRKKTFHFQALNEKEKLKWDKYFNQLKEYQTFRQSIVKI